MNVRGLLIDAPREEAQLRQFLSLNDIAFPVVTDSADVVGAVRAMRALGYGRTPVAILSDSSGRPQLILPPPESRGAEIRTERIVRRLLDHLRGGESSS